MYIPKNKIITGFYTNGEEFIVAGTNQSYTGVYYKLFNGNSYSGESPNDPNSRLLIKNVTSNTYKDQTSNNNPTLKYITYSEGNLLNYKYSLARPSFIPKRLLPIHTYPSPTNKDYEIGIFIRYFVVKENEIEYLEIDKNTYDQLSSQNPEWFWELYNPFILQWTITGDRITVARTNENIVKLTQREIGKEGLTEFLQGNYLQFYMEENEMISPMTSSSPPNISIPDVPTPPPTPTPSRRITPMRSSNYSSGGGGY
tara:strand:- start:1432 stop:2199 length:768 start_codon:yes stop_codon:yes gene_type:complete